MNRLIISAILQDQCALLAGRICAASIRHQPIELQTSRHLQLPLLHRRWQQTLPPFHRRRKQYRRQFKSHHQFPQQCRQRCQQRR